MTAINTTGFNAYSFNHHSDSHHTSRWGHHSGGAHCFGPGLSSWCGTVNNLTESFEPGAYIAGNRGDNVLEGTSGNDTILGRRGNDQLHGNEGNDLLIPGRGNDDVDGGEGEDTVLLRGPLSRYSIALVDAGNTLEFTNSRNGDVTTVATNVEHFQFRDQTLTLAEAVTLSEKVDPVTETLYVELSTEQRDEALEQAGFFYGGAFTVAIEDVDGSGNVTAGDVLTVRGGITGDIISTTVLTVGQAQAIENPGLEKELALVALNDARDKWDSQAVSDYSYTLQRSCYCGPESLRPADLEIVDGEVVSATPSDGLGGQVIEANQLTIDDMFSEIETVLNNGGTAVVTYDDVTGQPLYVSMDPIKGAIDDEVRYSLTPVEAATTVVEPEPEVVVHEARDVNAVANRMPEIGGDVTNRDYVFLGQIDSYPSEVVSITLNNETFDVSEQGNIYIARGVDFGNEQTATAELTLADGSVVPLNINVNVVY